MSDRIPIKSPAGVPGWLYLDNRVLRAEFPAAPKIDEEFSLVGVDLGRLAGMLLDQEDAEMVAERHRSKS